MKIPVEDVVVGDHAVAEEGSLLAADGTIVQSNDFSVNESILTGEAFAVARSAEDPENAVVHKGTQVVSGLALYRVDAVGMGSRLGRISGSLASIEPPPTPLQQQIGRFVRNMAIVGVVFFALVWAPTRRGAYCPRNCHTLETVTVFWHMVDLLWMVLFPLVYVLR